MPTGGTLRAINGEVALVKDSWLVFVMHHWLKKLGNEALMHLGVKPLFAFLCLISSAC